MSGAVWLLLTSAALGSCACPVRLLQVVPDDTGGEGLHLADGALDYLNRLASPVYVVPVLGVYRGGKSFLLNRLRGLRAPYEGGFGVGHTQETFTRGIEACDEQVEGLGTVLWMDTEGLWSKQDALSALAPKIASLALLFSSTLMLNSMKVLSEEFFSFFEEQQQLARILRDGLKSQHIPAERMLPLNLSVFWVVQQPIAFSSDINTEPGMPQMLEGFFQKKDDTRSRILNEFNHHLHLVPTATYDSRQWTQLEQVPDEDITEEYIDAAMSLRQRLLDGLRFVRPLPAAGTAKMLQMYLDVVQHKEFSGALAKEAFEEAEIATICAEFHRKAEEAAGPLPSANMTQAFEAGQEHIKPLTTASMQQFYFTAEWSGRLQRCLHKQMAELQRINGEEVLNQCKETASELAEGADCYFLGTFYVILQNYSETFGDAFSGSVYDYAIDFGTALQRTKLAECVKLKSLLWPFVPWLVWPVCSMYLRHNLSGLFSMALHLVLLAGIYYLLNLTNQLPFWMDVELRILSVHPLLLDLAMLAPPIVPWQRLAQCLGFVGLGRGAFKAFSWRPRGERQAAQQLVVLEQKLNMVLAEAKLVRVVQEQQIAAAALDASEHIESGDARAAAIVLVKACLLVSDAGAVDQAEHRRASKVRQIVNHAKLPPRSHPVPKSCKRNDLLQSVLCRDFAALVVEMGRLLKEFSEGADQAEAAEHTVNRTIWFG